MSTPGLVVSSTSDTARRVTLDPVQSRCNRLRRAVKWAGFLHDRQSRRAGARPWRAWMVTLTYAAVDGWHASHITQCIKRVREWLKRRGLPMRYVWVAELQQRGAVHYHMVLWLPPFMACPKFDARGWWTHGMTNRIKAHSAIGYLCKYASKFDGSVAFPDGLRTHGKGGLDADGRDVMHWWSLPGWLREHVSTGQRVMRPEGGGFVIRGGTGEVIRSPWRFAIVNHVPQARELFRYEGGVSASGPFSRLAASEFQRSELAFS